MRQARCTDSWCSLTRIARPARFADGVTVFGCSTSLIAAFSSARSAYIRFSFAFSASSSRSRFRSEHRRPRRTSRFQLK